MNDFVWKDGAKVTIRAGGAMLEGACFGPTPSEAPTIVMLHEGLGCVKLWNDFPQKLAQETGHGVFAYSRAGYGQSEPADLPRPIDYMTREALDVLPDVLDAIGVEHGVLLGHSDGASIAAIYAGSVEDRRIRGIVLIAPHFFTEEMGLASIVAARSVYTDGDLRAKLEKSHKDPDNAFWGWNDAWTDPAFKSWNIEEVIDYLRIPVLAIQGADDQYGTLAQIKALEDRLYSPLDAVILDDCKHLPHREKQEETLAAISDFVKRLDRIEHAEVEIR